jgi:hypoxanthine phosphoribosyltransferase
MDGSAPKDNIYILEEHQEFLRSNSHRTVLIVDDTRNQGTTIDTVSWYLYKLGFHEVHYACGSNLAELSAFTDLVHLTK